MSMRVLLPFLLIAAVVYTHEDNSDQVVSLSFHPVSLEMPSESSDSIQQRPIMIQTRRSRTKLECILNLRSFELCRNLF